MSKGQRNRLAREAVKEVTKLPSAKSRKHTEAGITTGGYYRIKWLAIVFMLCGMVVYALYEPLTIPDNIFYAGQILQKIAYVLFCFLCSESYFHTKNKAKHFAILMAIALLAEIPYDIITFDEAFNPEKQNPVGGLAMGFLTLCILNVDYEKAFQKIWKRAKRVRKYVTNTFKFILFTGLCILTTELGFDYDWRTIYLIVFFAMARDKKLVGLREFFIVSFYTLFTLDMLNTSLGCMFALIPIWIEQYRINHEERFIHIKKLDKIFCSKASVIITRIFFLVSVSALAVARIALS